MRFCADLQPKYAGCDAIAYLYSARHAIASNSFLGLPLYQNDLLLGCRLLWRPIVRIPYSRNGIPSNMNIKTLLLAAVALLVTTTATQAAEPTYTSITVQEMHCAGCARKIAAQLYAVRGVKEVRVNVEKKILYVLPSANTTLSPRAIWIAVENQDTPIRLAGPSGIFISRPKS